MSRSSRLHPVLLATLAVALTVPCTVEAQVDVEGAWTVTEWTVDGQTTPAQRGIFIFTSTHYSVFFVSGPDPRAVPAVAGPGGMTDEEKVVAYDEFTANAGRYTIEGNTMTTRALLAKNPGYMAGWPDNAQEYTVRRDGDTLSLVLGNGNVATLVRREGQPFPG